ncbi:MAG TPA: BofC C-terminal domain-containing protein [bacterium]|jgi:hypothetical protein|nr:BofC C-terminal domain-containing protein [bacterium]
MRARYYRSLLLRAAFIVVGIVVVIVAATWIRNGSQRHNSQQAAVLPQSPPLLMEHRRYENCGHNTEKELELSPELRRLKPEELAQLYNAASYQVSEERLRVFSSEPGLCPQCKGRMFVGIYGDKVAMFYGMPAGPHQLKEETNIPVGKLPPHAAADLKAGIPVDNYEELLYLLEGLTN